MKKILTPIALLVILASTTYVFAGDKPSGTPFQFIWDAIASLQSQIDDIELIPGPAGNGLRLYDGNGQDLGIFLTREESHADYHISFHEELDAILATGTRRADLRVDFLTECVDLYFEESDCTGQTYVVIEYTNIQSVVDVCDSDDGYPYYTVDTDEIPQTRVMLSRTNGDSCQNFSGPTDVDYTMVGHETDLPFTLPLAWPLRIEVE